MTARHDLRIIAFPFSAVFVSSAGVHPDVGVEPKHLLRLRLRVANVNVTIRAVFLGREEIAGAPAETGVGCGQAGGKQ